MNGTEVPEHMLKEFFNEPDFDGYDDSSSIATAEE